MRNLLILISMLFFSTTSPASVLGLDVDMSKLTPIEKILASPNDYLNSPVTIKGKVVAVCKMQGCWAEVVASSGKKLKLKVRDGETVIPMSARGKYAYATGLLDPVKLSKDQAILYLEHMANDAGETFDRSQVTTGLTLYNLRPSALKIVDK